MKYVLKPPPQHCLPGTTALLIECEHLGTVNSQIALKEVEVYPHTSTLCATFSFDLCGLKLGHGTVSSNMVLFLVSIAIIVLSAFDI